MGRHTGPVCRLCRREGTEAVPEGDAVRHPQVRRRPPRRRAGHAPVPPRQGRASTRIRLREKQKVKRYLRHLRAAVPQVLRDGQPPPGQHRRRADVAPGAPARQRRAPGSGFATSRAAGPPDRSRHGHITVNGRKLRHPQLPGPARRPDPGQEPRALAQAGRRATCSRGHARRSPTGSTGSAPTRPRAASPACPAAQDIVAARSRRS